MKRQRRFVIGVAVLLLCAGCGAVGLLVDLVQPGTVVVRLVNDGDYAVQVKLFIDDHQDIPEELLTDTGTELNFTVPAGETTAFSRKCDDLQAIVIDDAQLMVVGKSGPDAKSDVLRDGTDFGCGDIIVFTFEHSDLILDFHISVNVESK